MSLRPNASAFVGIGHSPLFRFDVVEFTRHSVSLDLDDGIKAAIAACQAGDAAAANAVAAITARVTALDDLMGAQPRSLAPLRPKT